MKIGVLGGGQLAKMLAMSAIDLDIELVCVDAQADACVKDIAELHQVDISNSSEIDRYFAAVDCITYETENLPFVMAAALANKYNLIPTLEALRITQDRLLEKNFLRDLAIPVADYASVGNQADLQLAVEKFDYPLVLKTRRHGYDGKGQLVIKNKKNVLDALSQMNAADLVVEKMIPFNFEISLIAARGISGEIGYYPPVVNQHEHGILRMSQAPYKDVELQDQARSIIKKIMEKLNYIGVMTVEFFCIDGKLLVNEIAPRVHNSGHWTIEGAVTSQFENHLRAIAGFPLGSTEAKGCSAMINIIGDAKNQQAYSGIPNVYYHWYGKEPRPGRKLGHVTICAEDEKKLSEIIQEIIKI